MRHTRWLLIVGVLTGLAAMAAASRNDAAQEGLLPALAKIQEKELGDLHRARTAREKIEEAGVTLGRWYRIGPFRSYRENDLPYFVAGDKPAWYVSGKTWWDALWASAKARRAQSVPDEGPEIVLADFEGPDYGHWKATGEAFGAGPARGTLPRQMEVTGFQGNGLVNSYLQGDGATGTLTSPAFKIERNGITFLIGGGRKPWRCCINLLVGGQAVRTATGRDNERLEWQHWDVGEFRGCTVRGHGH
ncbi:MAG: hypothetical protein IMZ66_02875 [Planctomycetes bacterium]|nr:hypothetical protein [Planctomycetota bacterium]